MTEEQLEDQPDAPMRRESDHTCVMHDYVFAKNDECINRIKEHTKAEAIKNDHRFEIVDTKFDAVEEKLENYLTRGTLGIIVSVCTASLVIMFGLIAWQINRLSTDIENIKNSSVSMNEAAVKSLGQITGQTIRIEAKQEGILRELEKLAPEHRQLMQHLNESK